MEIITLDNIRHYNFYNKCDICDRTKNLNECNICKDLYCIKCEIFKKNLCSYCYYQKYGKKNEFRILK